MAEAKLIITVAMKDAFTKGMAGVSRFLVGEQGKIGAAFSRVTKSVFNLRNAIVGGLAAVVTKKLAGAYATQEAAEARLTNAMKLRGEFTEQARDSMMAFASQLQATTTIGDEVTIGLLAQAKALGRTDEQAKSLITASADLAAATGRDVKTAFEQLNVTYSGQIGRMGMLIPALKDLTEAELKAGAGVALVGKQMAGMAAGEAKTFGGQLKQLGGLWSDLKEKLGAFVAAIFQSGLGEWIKTVLVMLNKELESSARNFKESGSSARAWGDQIKGAMKVVGGAVALVGMVSHGLEGIWLVIRAAGLSVADFLIDTFDRLAKTVSGILSWITGKVDAVKLGLRAAGGPLAGFASALELIDFSKASAGASGLALITGALAKETEKAKNELAKQATEYANAQTPLEKYNKMMEDAERLSKAAAAQAGLHAAALEKQRKEMELLAANAGADPLAAPTQAAPETTAFADSLVKLVESGGRSAHALALLAGQERLLGAESERLTVLARELSDELAAGTGDPQVFAETVTQLAAVQSSLANVRNLTAPPDGALASWHEYYNHLDTLAVGWAQTMQHTIDQVAGGVANIVGDAVGQVLQGEITSVKELGKALQDMFTDLAIQIVTDMIKISIQMAIMAGIKALMGGGGGVGGDTGMGGVGMAQGGVVRGGVEEWWPGERAATGGVFVGPTPLLVGDNPSRVEAVVPMPDGQKIPVDVRGGGVGGPAIGNFILNVSAMDGPSVVGTLARPEAQAAITAAVVAAQRKNSRFRAQMKPR